LTGGPGAGKTAVLEIVRKHFCSRVVVLPEAAGIVYGGGFWRKPSIPARKAAQRAIFHVQVESERLVAKERMAIAAFCDRGTLDGLAYWPGTEEEYWRDLQTSREKEFAKYSAVIHLRTPTAFNGYDHSNPLRIESPSEAARIDERILDVWKGHPNRIIVESSPDFLEKAAKTLHFIQQNLPACCQAHAVSPRK
jgi:predicted ATPase